MYAENGAVTYETASKAVSCMPFHPGIHIHIPFYVVGDHYHRLDMSRALYN
jgi:hypothetical protein